jgi:hypothetical protein
MCSMRHASRAAQYAAVDAQYLVDGLCTEFDLAVSKSNVIVCDSYGYISDHPNSKVSHRD